MLKVTKGYINKIGNTYHCNKSKMRAIYNRNVPNNISMVTNLNYLGETNDISKLKSGVIKKQFCHQMRRCNQNQLYYFCIEFDNPIRTCILKKWLKSKTKSKYLLMGEKYLNHSLIDINKEIIFQSITENNNLSLFVNNILCCEVEDLSYQSGNIGIRSDNAIIHFVTDLVYL